MLQFTCLSPCGAYVHVLEILRGFMSWDHCASTQVRYLYLFHNQPVVPDFHFSLTPTPPPSHRNTKGQKYNSLNTCFFFFFFCFRVRLVTLCLLQTVVESHIIALYLVFIIFFAGLFTVSFWIINQKRERHWKKTTTTKKVKGVLIHVICFLQCSAPISVLDETKRMLDMNRLFLCSWP